MRNAALAALKGLEWLNLHIGLIVGCLVLFMTIAILREVIGRYLFNDPTAWALELSEYSLLFLAYLGAAYTLLVEGHVKVDIFYNRWSLKTRSIADVISSLIGMVYCAVLIWQGSKLALMSLEHGAVSSGAMGLPLFPLQIIVPIGSALLLLQFIGRIYHSIEKISGIKEG